MKRTKQRVARREAEERMRERVKMRKEQEEDICDKMGRHQNEIKKG